MPSDRHLTVTEIADFTPGLYENPTTWLMPVTAAQEMTDCYPQPGGGLRAFYKGTDFSVTGIVDPTHERPIGIYTRGGVAQRSGAPGDGVDRYLMTYRFSAGATKPRLYRMDGSNNESVWTQIFATSGTTEFNLATSDNNFPQKASFRTFRLADGTAYVVFTVTYVGAQPGGPGLYKLLYSDLSSAQKAVEVISSVVGITNPQGALAVHQARVITSGGVTGDTIIWSDAGALTFSAPNFLSVEPNQALPGIIAIRPQPPSALLLVKEGAPMVTVNGVITSPTVYALAEGVAPGGTGKQDMGQTPQGSILIATDGYIYLTDGNVVTNLSEQLGSFAGQADFVGPGDTNFVNEFLFCPNGYVLHWPTKAWFKQTRIAGAIHAVERYNRAIFGPVGTGVSFAMRSMSPFPASARMNTFAWTSAPLRDPSGRQIEIREVELIVKAFDANATLAVTVNGVTITKTVQAGRQSTGHLFKGRGQVLDVRVVSTAGNSANEAPAIEAVRIKSHSGHQV